MIEVKHLTKVYGPHRAIDDVSFSVAKGEILGFLGPNGAGKTTTMRILAGYFPATEGSAMVAGYDVFESPMEAKRLVGYLPENPPLYTEMSVDSYLRFAGRIKGVSRGNLKKQVEYAKERCGLTGDGGRLIKHLSKGYRQRVGLAQALIHDPDVLILDEPTIGLDPKQIIEVRELIRSLGGDHTVILSTHILPEVSMTCERVVIINNGRIAAIDSPGNLTHQLSGGERIELEVGAPLDQVRQLIMALEGVKAVEARGEPGEGLVRLTVESDGRPYLKPQIARAVIEAGYDLHQIRSEVMSLEEVFLKLTTEEEAAV